MSGTRTIDFGKHGAGIGYDLPEGARDRLISERGSIDAKAVRSALASLSIAADEADVESVRQDLLTMRVTTHREKNAALDLVLSGIEQVKENIQPARRELQKSGTQSSLEAAFDLAAYDKALMKLARTIDATQRAATWGRTKQGWADDAMWLALRLERIAARHGRASSLGFKASEGTTTRCIKDLLDLAGITQATSTISKALQAHPQAHRIGLAPSL